MPLQSKICCGNSAECLEHLDSFVTEVYVQSLEREWKHPEDQLYLCCV